MTTDHAADWAARDEHEGRTADAGGYDWAMTAAGRQAARAADGDTPPATHSRIATATEAAVGQRVAIPGVTVRALAVEYVRRDVEGGVPVVQITMWPDPEIVAAAREARSDLPEDTYGGGPSWMVSVQLLRDHPIVIVQEAGR